MKKYTAAVSVKGDKYSFRFLDKKGIPRIVLPCEDVGEFKMDEIMDFVMMFLDVPGVGLIGEQIIIEEIEK